MRDTRTYRTVVEQIRVALYLRLSDLDDDNLDDNGVERTFGDREQELRDFAEDQGWEVAEVVIENDLASRNGKQRNASAYKRRKVTLPDGSTAMRVVRPGFDKIIDWLKSGHIHALITEDGDRITRDPYDGGRLIDIVEARKLNVRTLTGRFNLTNGGTDAEIGAAWDAVNAANQESRKIANRVRRGRKRKARKGEFGGGHRRYGLEKDGVTIVEAERMVIETMSKRVIQMDGRPGRENKSMSLRLLAAELNAAGTLTATGKQWRAQTLREMLLRPINAGIGMYKGERVGKAPNEPMIPESLWQSVVDTLTDPARVCGDPGAAPRWLGTGLYLCGVCQDGSTCVVSGGTGRGQRYQCKGNNHLSRNAAHLDAFVRSVVVERLSRPDAVRMFAGPARDTTVDTNALREEATTVRMRMEKMATDYALGVGEWTASQVQAANRAGTARLARISELLAAAAPVESPIAELLGADDVAAAWDAAPLSVQRTVVDTLCTVTILPTTIRGSGFHPETVRITPKIVPTSHPDIVSDTAA